jgi:hypothetical protein
VGIGGICYPQGVRIEPPVATQFPLYILGSNITCGQLVAPNNINDYPALGILSSNDSFNRLVFGLTNGTPFFGLGPGSGNRDIFVRRQSASTLRIAGNSAGSSSGNLEVTGQIQATGTTASTSTTTGALTVAGGAGIAGALHVGNPNASTAQLTVNGGNAGTAIIKLSRTVGATASYTWNLGGGRLSFTDDIANVTTLQTGVSGSTSIVVIGSDISSASTSPGFSGLLKGSDAGGAAADITGGNLTIQSGRGRGAATPTSIFFNTPDVESSGTTLQSVSTRLTVNHEGITAAGQIRSTATTASISTTTGALRIDGGAGIAGALHVGGQINGLGAVQSGTPASAAATGTAGQIRWDADYIYVCTATNTWKRVAISTW